MDRQGEAGSRQQLQQLSNRLQEQLDALTHESELNKIEAQKQNSASQATINSLEQEIAQLENNYHTLEEETSYHHADLERRLKEAENEAASQNASRLKLQEEIETLRNEHIRVEGNR